jgi:hypothetical protein
VKIRKSEVGAGVRVRDGIDAARRNWAAKGRATEEGRVIGPASKSRKNEDNRFENRPRIDIGVQRESLLRGRIAPGKARVK